MRFRITTLLIAIVCCARAYAAITIIRPLHPPTSNDVIIAGVPVSIICTYTSTVTVQGYVVRVVMDTGSGRCVLGPPAGPGQDIVGFGPLPAGTYTIEVYHSWEGGAPAFVERTTFLVIEATSVPALGPIGLAVLTFALGVTALLVLRASPG